MVIIGEIGKTCQKCGKFFLGNRCPSCGWEVLSVTPKPIMRREKPKKRLKGVSR